MEGLTCKFLKKKTHLTEILRSSIGIDYGAERLVGKRT
jgi:hypothetical protein